MDFLFTVAGFNYEKECQSNHSVFGRQPAIYIAMDIVPNAPEGFNLAVSKRFSMPFSKSKVLSDCLFIAVGVVISLLSQGKITAIREGTLVSALLTGIIIGKFQKILNEPLKRVAFEEKNICEGELVNE